MPAGSLTTTLRARIILTAYQAGPTRGTAIFTDLKLQSSRYRAKLKMALAPSQWGPPQKSDQIAHERGADHHGMCRFDPSARTPARRDFYQRRKNAAIKEWLTSIFAAICDANRPLNSILARQLHFEPFVVDMHVCEFADLAADQHPSGLFLER